MVPDIGTLYFSSMLSRIAILMVFLVFTLSQQSGAYLYHWIWALLASTLGSLVSIRYSGLHIFPLHVAVVIYFFFLSSMAASWSGLRLFYGHAASVRTMLKLSVLPGLLYAAAVEVGVPEWIMMPFIYLAAAVIAGCVLYEIFMAPEKRLFSQYVVATAFSCYSLALIIPAVLILGGRLATDVQTGATTPMLVDQVASILVYFGYIAMAGERATLILKKQAETDPLTRLLNRRGAQKLLDRLYLSAGAGMSCCVLIADIDHFKRINDELGHDAGDAVLVALAGTLMSGVRKGDNVVRWGGEEFLIILFNTTPAEAVELAERLRLQTETMPVDACQKQITVTLSIGVAEVEPTDNSVTASIIRADTGLYLAKQGGRNRVCRV